MSNTQHYEYTADQHGPLTYDSVTVEVTKPISWYGDEVDHAASSVIDTMKSVFPQAYADSASGHTRELIGRALQEIDLDEYSRELAFQMMMDEVELYTGTARFAEAPQQTSSGFVKINSSPVELQEKLGGTIVEVAELAATNPSKRLHLGSALLFTALKPLANEANPGVVGRIPGFCERSIRIATEELGMQVVLEDEAILFPHNRPVLGRLAKAIGKPLVRPVQWNVYGGVSASDICERLVAVQPWLAESYEDA